MTLIQEISFMHLWAVFALTLLLRFIVFAFGSYLVFYPSKSEKILKKKIQKKFPSKEKIKYEIKQSLVNLILLGILSSIILYQIKNGVGNIYYEISEYGTVYFAFSIFLLMVLHDSWFYWIHRVMHHPKLYKYLHSIHHKSVNPTPFTSFSMDWTEMILEFGIFPILILIVPIHPIAFSIFTFLAFMFNILGHLGYEIFPEKLIKSRFGKLINTSTKHNQHHEKFNYNFSYYFTIWDKIMKTEYQPKTK